MNADTRNARAQMPYRTGIQGMSPRPRRHRLTRSPTGIPTVMQVRERSTETPGPASRPISEVR